MKNKKAVQALLKDALILFLITLISGVCLGFVNDITKDIIAQREEQARIEANQAVCPSAASFETNEELMASYSGEGNTITMNSGGTCEINEVLNGLDGSGSQVGYVVTVTSNDGYSGDIQLSVGIDMEGSITGVELLVNNESAGLGANASNPEFTDQYKGKAVEEFVVTKTGKTADNEIDALSGATITSQAVTDGVNAALLVTRAAGK